MGERRGTKALELWCRRMVEGYKNVRVDNMTTSWRDGLAFCALVSKCSTLKQLPDLIHFDELKKENVFYNNDLAFRVAEEYLGIPSLLDPQDMVDYEIPDKLSILTYLSQYYQVFGAQENSLRLSKRSSTEANKSSTTSTPPAKMAHVVPKREPCVKCNYPVFFAERLVIENHLYHRTCFKCARCESVLTLGNFYQTEKDNEFCCETCPDEELKSKRTSKVDESNRLSIAQRIALFEKTETTSVLKKSLSDEEKSKSLSRQMPTSTNSHALNSFLTSQIDDDDGDKTNESLSSDSESESEQQQQQPEVEVSSISDSKLVSISDHNNDSVISDENVNSTKELTHNTTTANESQQLKDTIITQVANEVVLDNSNDDDDDFTHDDIELEFERLAEEAVNNPIVIVPLPEKKPQQNSIKIDEIEVKVKVEEKKEEEVEAVVVVEEKKEEQEEEIKAIVVNENIVKDDESQIQQDPIKNDPLYPDDLNPFGDDEEEAVAPKEPQPKKLSLNPFGSCSEDEQDEIQKNPYTGTLQKGKKPPRPPLPKAMTLKPTSTNPFGSDDDDDDEKPSLINKTPIPTPRKQLHTPEPLPRVSAHNSPGHSFKGSTSSLASSSDGLTMRRKKKKAPAPPTPNKIGLTSDDKMKTPRKKRPAPTPPTSTPLKQPPITVIQAAEATLYMTAHETTLEESQEINDNTDASLNINCSSIESEGDQRRLIPLGESLVEEGTVDAGSSSSSAINSHIETQEVTFRRKIVPLSPTSPNDENCENLEQIKDHKEAENRHRQSQSSLKADSSDSLPYLNKSSHGKWKRRKGPAPQLPNFAVPQRRVLQMLPLQEIRHELEVIEVQQQGLEKQGVMLEKMIRERCEGDNRTTEELLESLPNAKNPKEVEELILQLFELVNEKNELFRRQAELMYLRRAHRLEEEQADVEYEIRTLMAQPEQNKTDSDKAKEEALISRLVEIVQLRNEVVDCLEMDRLREAEEDLSIKQRMESHTAKLDQEYLNQQQTPTKLSKKEKKKLKEAKKMKNKKLNDADKDLDTSELKAENGEKKKKKKKFLF